MNTRVIINGVSREMTPNEIEEANKMLISDIEESNETSDENKK